MPINSNEKWKKIEKNKKYFDVNNRERKKFSDLKDELKDVCELCVSKEFSIYKIEFLDKKGKSIHLPYVYRSKQVFKQKFGIDPTRIIQQQNNTVKSITRSKKNIQLTNMTIEETEGQKQGKQEEEAKNKIEVKQGEKKEEAKNEIIMQKEERDTEKKEGFFKKIRNKIHKHREEKREKNEKEAKIFKVQLYAFIGVVLLGISARNFYREYMDSELKFPTLEDGTLDYYNNNSTQTSDQTQTQSYNQTESQEQSTVTNNSEPTTIEGKPFTGDISDFFNENTVIISHSRMNGIKHLLPKSIKEENYYAVDGATTANAIEWMQAANENTTITRVYISMGINDLVKSDMDKLIEEVHKKFPNAIIYEQKEYVANRFDENRRNQLEDFNEHSKELCSNLDYAYYIEITNNKHNLAHENGDIIGEEDEVYGNKDAAIHIVDPEQQKKLIENIEKAIQDVEKEIYLKNHQNTSQNSTTEQSTENTGADTQNSKGNIYYVSKENSDDEQTSKTISEAVEKAQPRDTIIVKEGDYNEKVKIHNKQDITIKAEGEVTIDGKNLSGSLFSIKNSKNVCVEGLVFAHMLADSSQGVKVYGDNTSDITIDNCVFEDIRCVHEKDDDKGSNAIYVVGSSTTPIDNIVIKNCKCTDVAAGFSEVISFEGNITNFLIENVIITSNNVKSNIGICICGNQGTCEDKKLDRPRKGTIRNCNVSKCKSPYDPDSSYGLYIEVAENILVENNTVSLCEGGIEIGAEIASSAFSGIKKGDTENITVKNNYILNCLYGVQIGGFEEKRGTVYKVIFEGNELQNCGSKDSEMLTLTKCNNVTIKNNKFISDEDGKVRVINIKMPEKLCYDIDFEKNEFKVKYITENPNAKCFEYKGRYYNLNSFYRAIEHISMSQER